MQHAQGSSAADNADMMQQELAMLEEQQEIPPSDSNDTMADDSNESMMEPDMGMHLCGFDMQPDLRPPSTRVSFVTSAGIQPFDPINEDRA